MAAAITARYGKGSDTDQPVSIRVLVLEEGERILEALPMGFVELEEYRVG
jgi:hypothetical protein